MASKIWYSFQEGVSEDDHIGFYDTDDLAWTKELEDNWEIIAKEVSEFIANNQETIKPYFNKELVSKAKSWKTFSFKVWGWSISKNLKKCPETAKVLSRIPNLSSASVSMLQPHTDIKPHRGDTNAIMRSHLALKVPKPLPDCGMRVKYDDRAWEEGKVLVFNDSAWHKAWNHSDELRYVLIVDVVRPEFKSKKYRVCSIVLGYLVMQMLVGKLGFLEKAPKIILKAMLAVAALSINSALRIKSFFT